MSVTDQSPRRMSSAERREQLLDATKTLAAEKGFHAVSIDAVAKRAGISRPIVYGHFGDLPGLLEALVERESIRALGQLTEILPVPGADDDLRDALMAAFSGYLRVAESDPDTWRLVLMPPEGAPEALRERIRVGRDAVVEQIAGLVRDGLSPTQRPPDPELAARMLSALADEAIRLRLTEPDSYSAARVEALAEWLISGFSNQR